MIEEDHFVIFDPIPSVYLSGFAGWVLRNKFESAIRKEDGELITQLFSYHGEYEYTSVDEEFIDLFLTVEDTNPIFKEILSYNCHLSPFAEIDTSEELLICVELEELLQAVIKESNGGLRYLNFKSIDPVPHLEHYILENYVITIDKVKYAPLMYDGESFKRFLKDLSPSLYEFFLRTNKPPAEVTAFQRNLEQCAKNKLSVLNTGDFGHPDLSYRFSDCKVDVGEDGKLRWSLT